MSISLHQRRTTLLILTSLALLVLAALASTPSGARAQSSCEDPFGDTLIRFSTRFWTLTDFCQHSVSYDEIVAGGPPPDGIPPIDGPFFDSIEEALQWLQPQSPVIALQVDGEAKAYPLSIMIWHEIANDTIGDTPVAVTFCPLCNSAIVFNSIVDGEALRFGVSGNLRNSDLIMWDDRTQSWWQQFTGEGIVGAHTGRQLEVIPSQIVSFGAFVEQFPDGLILSRDTGVNRNYGASPYRGYDSDSDPFLFLDEPDERLFPTERVLAGIIGGEAIAYPFPALSEVGVINDTVGNRNVVAIWQPGAVSALDRAVIDTSRDVGMAALFSREVDGRALTFNRDATGVIRDDETNSEWNVFGTAVSGPLAGAQLRQQVAAPHFWFAWAAFQPDTLIFGQE